MENLDINIIQARNIFHRSNIAPERFHSENRSNNYWVIYKKNLEPNDQPPSPSPYVSGNCVFWNCLRRYILTVYLTALLYKKQFLVKPPHLSCLEFYIVFTLTNFCFIEVIAMLYDLYMCMCVCSFYVLYYYFLLEEVDTYIGNK